MPVTRLRSQLPLDIIQVIVEQAEDDVAPALSLVDRQTMRLARKKRLFSTLFFGCRSHKKFDKFLDLIQKQDATLPSAVVSLEVDGLFRRNNSGILFKSRPNAPSLGSRLVNTKFLVLKNFHWDSVPKDIVSFFSSIPAFHVSLSNLHQYSPESFIEQWKMLPSTLESISLRGNIFEPDTHYDSDLEYDYEEDYDPSDVRDELEVFKRPIRFSFLDARSLRCFHSVWDPTRSPRVASWVKVDKFSISLLEKEEWFPLISRFLRAIGPRLDQLSIGLDGNYALVARMKENVKNVINCSTCTSLRQIHFEMPVHAAPQSIFSDIPRIAEAIPSREVEVVGIKFKLDLMSLLTGYRPDVHTLQSLPWITVLRRLTRVFGLLQRLRIIFIFKDRNGFGAALVAFRKQVGEGLEDEVQKGLRLEIILKADDEMEE